MPLGNIVVLVYKQIFISGIVQGVFFRDSTRQKAKMLDLRGSVKNLRDGRVEVQVAGDKAVVQSLINWLKIGPKHAKVTTIEVIDIERFDSPDGRFEIFPTQ